jgi:plasmid maintenance system antidote protein VapI
MARPAGFRLSRTAWEDILRLSGLNLTRVAELADIPRPTLSALVGGHNRASIPMAHRIADALGCHANTLFPDLIVTNDLEAVAQ